MTLTALCSLALPVLLQAGTEGLEAKLTWESPPQPTATQPLASNGVFATRAGLTLTATRTEQSSVSTYTPIRHLVTLLESDGTLRWQVDEQDVHSSSFDFQIATVADVAWSDDGDRVYVLVEEFDATSYFFIDRVGIHARSAATGELLWSTYSGESMGAMSVGGGRVALSSGIFDFFTAEPTETQTLLYDGSTGAFLNSSSIADELFEVVSIQPSTGQYILRSEETAELRAYDWDFGQLDWSYTGANAESFGDVVVDATSQTVVVEEERLTGDFVTAVDLATGLELWTQLFPGALGGIDGANGALFASGQLNAALLGLRRIDAQTGVIGWETSVSSGSFPQGTLTSFNAAADRVAVVAQVDGTLHRFDATSGTALGSSALGGSPAVSVEPFELSSGDGWIVGKSNEHLPVDEVVVTIDAAGNQAWTQPGLTPLVVPLAVQWMEAVGTTLHSGSAYVVNPALFPDTLPLGAYEIRDLEDGEVLASWALPADSPRFQSAALSPDGSLVALTEPEFNLGIDSVGRFEVRDTQSGRVVIDEDYTPVDFPTQNAVFWAPDNSTVYLVWGTLGQIFVRSYTSAGSLNWDTTLSAPGGTNLTYQDAVVLASNDLVLATVEGNLPGFNMLRTFRLDAVTGAEVASGSFDVDSIVQDTYYEATEQIVNLGSSGQLAFLIGGFGTGIAQLAFFVVTDAATLQSSNLVWIGDPSQTADFEDAATVVTPSGDTLMTAGRVELGLGTSKLEIVAFDTTDFSERWRRTLDEFTGLFQQPYTELLANGKTLAVYVGTNNLSADNSNVYGFDVLTGARTFKREQYGLAPSSTAAFIDDKFEASGRTLVSLGTSLSPPFNASGIRGLELGALTDGGLTLDAASGGRIPFILDRGADAAGRVYLLLGSASGGFPGIPVDSVVIPLSADSYTTLMLTQANQGAFIDTLGVLDAEGTARAEIAAPPLNPALIGVTIRHASIDLELGSGVDFASNPTAITIDSATTD